MLKHYYRPQRSCEGCEGYVFTPVCQSFCSQEGEYLGRYPPPEQIYLWAGTPPPCPRSRYTPGQVFPLRQVPPAGTPPTQVHPGQLHPPGQVHPPRQVHLPGRRLLLRTVRILLECILVTCHFLLVHSNIWIVFRVLKTYGYQSPLEG